MEIHLPSVPMMEILSYLDAYSLLQAAQVNKNWNELASSDVLWRKLCQKRWLYCYMFTLPLHGLETWKQFFFDKTWQEHAKTRAKPEDFTYKEFPVEFEFRAHPWYISRHGLTRNGQEKSAVCMTSMNRISTWDIHEGAMTWESPKQPSYIVWMTTLPEMQIAVTIDMQSTIKLWDCHNKEVLASKTGLFFGCKLLQSEFTKDGPIVLVFYMSSLLRPSEFSAPVSTVLKVPVIRKVFWTPRREDRITLMSLILPKNITKFDTFDMKLEGIGNKVTIQGYLTASFSLAEDEGRPDYFGVSDKDVIVCSTRFSLLLFDINGLRLQTFHYCPEEIWRLWVDPVHVIVTCDAGSLDIYAWEKRSLLLRKCYRLRNRNYQQMSGYIIKTLCDDMSIISVANNSPKPCCLMAYTLSVCS
ncbi:F-box and WD-40 domain protein 28 isoform X1 [Mus musculus]|uniref:F-box and WD-40 domain protein 28 n=1 Tax=Mus musculus TaxID=10090 RepID=A0A0G2JFZ2_MOUSE|nr:F-box and WD-40 domain protein 28 isoform X1 [Mus musculus]|eukprot:XP_006512274.1 PREDICTED: F-box and WD-40 domain protein 28 isoform X1 [Mus musculus]